VDALRGVLLAGVDILRVNAAHGTAEEHIERVGLARKLAAELDRPVGLLVDLPGPKLRSGPVAGDTVELGSGQQFTLMADAVEGDCTRVGMNPPDLGRWLRPDDEVYLADGAIVLRVETVASEDVKCHVVRGGTLHSRKGMHVPCADLHINPFTDADEHALAVAVKVSADFVGLSFVRQPEDVERVRAKLPRHARRPHLVAKIETPSALNHLPGIVAAADAVMVARGDLGIEVPARRVPLIQKTIIRLCNIAGKPVITATHMLESMTQSPLPTRAEVNDVANAVIDGTDALMLSEETAVGAYPIDAVRTMAEVAETAETWPRVPVTPADTTTDDDKVSWAVAHAAVQAAEDLGVAAIVCPTRSGVTAQRVAAFRPKVPVLATSSQTETLSRLTLLWGVQPLALSHDETAQDHIRFALKAARHAHALKQGDLTAVVSALPGPRVGTTDVVRIVRA
jgi:pyruvate kinase